MPKDKTQRARFQSCFSFDPPQSEADQAAACERHRALQDIISKALKADRELKTSVKKRAEKDEEGATDGKAAEAKRRAL